MDKFLTGKVALWKTVWLFLFLGNIAQRVIINVMLLNENLTMTSYKVVTFIEIFYTAVVLIAVWNSATNYEGKKQWAILAKIPTNESHV